MKKGIKSYINRTNKEFKSLPSNEKMVWIAKDVLLRVERENLIPKQGSILEHIQHPTSKACIFLDDIPEDTSIKEIVNNNACEVCLKGALFCAYIGRVNKMKWKEMDWATHIESNFHKKLLEITTPLQLDLIETAFEGTSYLKIISDSEYNKAYDFYDKYEYYSHKDRLTAIMENIIENNGVFNP